MMDIFKIQIFPKEDAGVLPFYSKYKAQYS